MNIIYKYVLAANKVQSFTWPIGSRVLKVAEQHGDIVVWVRQPLTFTKRRVVEFFVVPTGVMFDWEYTYAYYYYVDTILMNDGELVFHIFVNEYGDIIDA